MSAVLDAGERLEARASAARGARWRRGGLLLLVAAAVGALGWLVLFSSVLAVERVVVSGTQRTTPAQVQAAAAVALGTPLARVDVDGVRARVGELDPVARVQVERGWPTTLRLRVVEREPVVGFLTQGRYVLLDAGAVPFAREPRLPEGAVRLQVRRPAADDPATRAALEVLSELPDGLRAQLAILRASSPAAVSLLLRDGRQVVWGGPGRGEDKAAAAQALLRLPGTVYDVSSPEVVTRRDPAGVVPGEQG